ncbi:MAG: hypothetical protein ACKPKO_52710, partial [Candidatus Fonsibacter sp.]
DESRPLFLTPPISRMLMSSPVAPPVQSHVVDASIESHVEAIVQELMEQQQVKSMETITRDTEELAFLAKARLRSAKQAFYRVAEQNEILADMAREVFVWYYLAFEAH